MSVKVTLEFATVQEAAAYLAGAAGVAPAVAQTTAPAVEVKVEKAAAVPKVEKAAKPKTESKTEAAATSTPAPTEETKESPASSVDYTSVQKAVFALANAKGRDAALAVIGTFGKASAKELAPEQYEAALAALTAALEA